MQFINNNWKALKAEWLKLRRSGIFWLIIGMSAFIPLIFTLIIVFTNEKPNQTDTNLWQEFIENCFQGFAGFFFPIFLILVASRLAQIEHRSGGWKLIETQPVHRFYLFLAKWQTAMYLSLFCLLGVLVFGLIGATIVSFTGIGEPFRKSSIPIIPMLSLIARLWIASFGIMAIQYFLSIWVPNFLFSFGIGLLAVIAASIISAFNVALWFPYSATILTNRNMKGSQTGAFLLHHEWLSIWWMLLFLWIGYQWYRFKSWKFALLKPAVKPLAWVAVAVIFGIGFWWIEKPVQLKRYGKTVIAGIINAADSVDHVVLMKMPVLDTVVKIPVKNNRFHYTGNLNIPLGEYVLATGRHGVNIIFSDNDSLFVEWMWEKQRENAKIKGTRVAENEHYRARRSNNDTYYIENYAYNFTPASYVNEVATSYSKRQRNMNRFRTVDNLKPADDYNQLIEKLNVFKYLHLLDINYPRIFSVYNPNDSLKYPPSVDRFRKKVDIHDSSLANFQEYRSFINALYHMKSGIPENRKDSSYFNYVAAHVPRGRIRDVLIYDEMKTVLSQVRDSLSRNWLVNRWTPAIGDNYLRELLMDDNRRLNSLGRGKPAPEFEAVALNNKDFKLKDFEGRYLVIDVWATWCVPCKKESPYFEELAEKYTSESVAFISLSVDQDFNAWFTDSHNKSNRVLQLWAKNTISLGKYFAIESIPRFMLIDPRGRIINIQMPYPSDPEFEEWLQKEIPSL